MWTRWRLHRPCFWGEGRVGRGTRARISPLKTSFPFYLTLQLQRLQGNELLTSQPVKRESGPHHHFRYSECPGRGSGDQSRPPPGITLLAAHSWAPEAFLGL